MITTPPDVLLSNKKYNLYSVQETILSGSIFRFHELGLN